MRLAKRIWNRQADPVRSFNELPSKIKKWAPKLTKNPVMQTSVLALADVIAKKELEQPEEEENLRLDLLQQDRELTRRVMGSLIRGLHQRWQEKGM